MRKVCVMLTVAMLLSACGGSLKKEYKKLEPINESVTVAPLYVARIGEITPRQIQQLPVSVDSDKIFVANGRGGLAALNEIDGRLLWRADLNQPISAGPAHSQGLLVIGTSNAEVLAFDAQDGKVKWRVFVSSEVLAKPAISKDKVIIQTIDGKLSALSTANGERIWSESREVPLLTLRGTTQPLIIDDMVVAGLASGHVIALNLETGKVLWETSITVPRGRTDLQRIVDIDGLMQADGNSVYVASYQGRIAALSLQNGAISWARDMSTYTGLVIDNTQLYLSDAEGYVWALDKKTGATLWRQDKLVNRDLSAPVLMDNTVVVADGAGIVHWLSVEDGAMVSRQDLKKVYDLSFFNWGDDYRDQRDVAVTTPPVVKNKRLYISDNAGALSVFSFKPATLN